MSNTTESLVIQKHKYPNSYITVSRLKSNGWTDNTINNLLGEPDKFADNPYYRCAAPMRLYERERVLALERSDVFIQGEALLEERRATALKAVETKKQKLFQHIKNVKIDVPVLPHDELIAKACKHYNDWGYLKEDRIVALPTDSRDFLNRISVNYLRHELTSYEHELDKIFGKVGIAEGRNRIRAKVYNAIAKRYLYLSEECQRQRREREVRNI